MASAEECCGVYVGKERMAGGAYELGTGAGREKVQKWRVQEGKKGQWEWGECDCEEGGM